MSANQPPSSNVPPGKRVFVVSSSKCKNPAGANNPSASSSIHSSNSSETAGDTIAATTNQPRSVSFAASTVGGSSSSSSSGGALHHTYISSSTSHSHGDSKVISAFNSMCALVEHHDALCFEGIHVPNAGADDEEAEAKAFQDEVYHDMLCEVVSDSMTEIVSMTPQERGKLLNHICVRYGGLQSDAEEILPLVTALVDSGAELTDQFIRAADSVLAKSPAGNNNTFAVPSLACLPQNILPLVWALGTKSWARVVRDAVLDVCPYDAWVTASAALLTQFLHHHANSSSSYELTVFQHLAKLLRVSNVTAPSSSRPSESAAALRALEGNVDKWGTMGDGSFTSSLQLPAARLRYLVGLSSAVPLRTYQLTKVKYTAANGGAGNEDALLSLDTIDALAGDGMEATLQLLHDTLVDTAIEALLVQESGQQHKLYHSDGASTSPAVPNVTSTTTSIGALLQRHRASHNTAVMKLSQTMLTLFFNEIDKGISECDTIQIILCDECVRIDDFVDGRAQSSTSAIQKFGSLESKRNLLIALQCPLAQIAISLRIIEVCEKRARRSSSMQPNVAAVSEPTTALLDCIDTLLMDDSSATTNNEKTPAAIAQQQNDDTCDPYELLCWLGISHVAWGRGGAAVVATPAWCTKAFVDSFCELIKTELVKAPVPISVSSPASSGKSVISFKRKMVYKFLHDIMNSDDGKAFIADANRQQHGDDCRSGSKSALRPLAVLLSTLHLKLLCTQGNTPQGLRTLRRSLVSRWLPMADILHSMLLRSTQGTRQRQPIFPSEAAADEARQWLLEILELGYNPIN